MVNLSLTSVGFFSLITLVAATFGVAPMAALAGNLAATLGASLDAVFAGALAAGLTFGATASFSVAGAVDLVTVVVAGSGCLTTRFAIVFAAGLGVFGGVATDATALVAAHTVSALRGAVVATAGLSLMEVVVVLSIMVISNIRLNGIYSLYG